MKCCKTFYYSAWEFDEFINSGRQSVQHKDYTMELSQSLYAKSLVRIGLTQERRQQLEALCSPLEKSAVQVANGKLGWLAHNSRPEFMFDWCVSRQRVSNCTVAELQTVNKAIAQAKRNHHVRIRCRHRQRRRNRGCLLRCSVCECGGRT